MMQAWNSDLDQCLSPLKGNGGDQACSLLLGRTIDCAKGELFGSQHHRAVIMASALTGIEVDGP